MSTPRAEPRPLPVDELLPRVAEAARARRCLVLEAPPGSGKTTRVPPALALALATGGRVVVVEPRRVAARSAAVRVAAETAAVLGERGVGHQVRHERRWTDASRVVFVTPGVLLQWMLHDPLLSDWQAIVFDEFHERSVDCDLLFALAVHLRRELRDDLVIAVLSATLESEPIARHLGAEVLRSGGREHPVEIRYLARPDERAVWQRAAAGVRSLLADIAQRRRGDDGPAAVLCFLPGVGEIRRTRALLEESVDVPVRELYGAAPLADQDAALRGPSRRVVLATNVAESSVTVEGVCAVVDSGLHRIARFDAGRGLDRLRIEPISHASADQRAGRAGRLGPGLCLRLWTESEQAGRPRQPSPEIERVDLAAAVLHCLALGERPEDLPWLQPPAAGRIAAARQLLELLGALQGGSISELGRRIAAMPMPPRLARLAIEGARHGAAEVCALAAALLAERDLIPPRRFEEIAALAPLRCDLEDRMQRLAREQGRRQADGGRGRQVLRTAEMVTRALAAPSSYGDRAGDPRARARRTPLPRRPLSLPAGALQEEDREALGRALIAAYPDRVARRRTAGPQGQGGPHAAATRALMVGGLGLVVAGSRVRDCELLVALEVQGAAPDARLHLASAIEEDWLPEESLEERDEIEVDASSGRVRAWRRRRYRGLVLGEEPRAVEDASAAEAALLRAALEDPECAVAFERERLAGFRGRAGWLASVRADVGVPGLGESAGQDGLAAAVVGRRSLDEVRRAPLLDLVRGAWRHDQLQALDRLAPVRLELPSGRSAPLTYDADGPPVLAARIQDLFGWRQTPRLAGGEVPVLLHLLAPNGRPQQITDDLAGFWERTYGEVRRELAGRYPKHHWPVEPPDENPTRR